MWGGCLMPLDAGDQRRVPLRRLMGVEDDDQRPAG